MQQRMIPLALIAVVAVAVVLIAGSSSGGSSHTLRAQFTSTEQLVPGLEVRIAGRKVGDITAVDLVGGNPVVTMEITESDVWPLPSGTTAVARWGSTTSLEYRYVELQPGSTNGAPLTDNALLGPSHTKSAVELDSFYRIFRGQTTSDLRNLVGELANTLGGVGPQLRSGLAAAPGGLDQTSAVLQQLGADQSALAQLVTQGNRVTGALAGRQADLGPLVDHAGSTFDELASNATAEQNALDAAPSALTAGTNTLNRLDTSIDGLQTLITNIAPGAVALRALAPAAQGALVELNKIAPLADSALRSGRSAAKPLKRLLDTGTPFLPQLSGTLNQLSPMVSCILPYGPEIAGTLSNWSSFNENYDAGGHYARTFDLNGNPYIIAGTGLSSHQVITTDGGGLTYAFPRPPGLNAGQPYLLPQCGAGSSALDPSQDPEG
jgi:phospholipid/cholesterol/gamma-HCH transport system substrate-binding protein